MAKSKGSSKSSSPSSSRDWSSILTADEYNSKVLNGDDSDESISSDVDCFNEEDERLYGDMFIESDVEDDQSDGDDEDQDEDEDEDGDESEDEDEDEEVDMLDMLSSLDKKTSKHRKEISQSHAPINPSSFSSTTTTTAPTLTMDSLLNPLSTTHSNYSALKSSVKSLKSTSVTHASNSTVVTERAGRKVAYKASSKDVSNWMDSVKSMREAETLDFRPKNREKVTTNSMVSKFEPMNDFEREIAEALEGKGEGDIKNMEDEAMNRDDDDDFGEDDLGRNTNLTLEEYKKRHGQLAKMRSLLFYEERKRHQINKIKSKKYRKIRKKQSDREKEKDMELLREQDPEAARALDEKEAEKRMKERMTLAHKNTSKWARQQLRRGNIDTDTRRALSQQVAIGDKLREKQTGIRGGDSEDEEEEEGGEDEEEMLKRKARKILADVEGDDEGEERSSQKSDLFKLAFMKKGVETQREKAKREARELLEELEKGEGEEEEEEDFDDEEEEDEEEDVEEKEKKGERTTIVGDGIEIDLDDDDDDDDEKEEQKTSKSTNVQVSSKAKSSNEGFDIASNPWMEEGAAVKVGNKEKKNKKNKKNVDSSVVDLDRGVSMIVGDDNNGDEEDVDITQSVDDDDGYKLEKMSQSELVKRAFAAPNDMEEEFKKEKQALIERDGPKKPEEEDDKVKGWGSWTGAGVRKPKKRKKLSKKLEAPKVKKVKRADEKLPTVIINEKRMKKMSKFKVASVPYPFTSAEQYERAMKGAIGAEWQTSQTVVNMTRPEIIARAGRIINPLGKTAKSKSSSKRKARF